MGLLIFYLLLALVVSFTCSIMESVLLSTPLPYLYAKKESGATWADPFLALKDNIDKPLSAILSLNTVAHTIGAAGVGAQATIVFGEAYFGLVSAILTILILVITEIIPKTIGARYHRSLARLSLQVIRVMIVITYPLVLLASGITKLISSKKVMARTSRKEISALTDIGAHDGLFTKKEHRIIQNLLRLKDVKVTTIMTPRVVLATADEEMFLKDFLTSKNFLNFSRIPVYTETSDNITGYVMRQAVFEKLAEDQHEMHLKDIRRDIVMVSEATTLFALWEMLLARKEHIALVLDEYGGVDGIVTMEDIIETLLGLEIVDESDTVTDMQEYARERWKMRQAKYKMLD